MSRRETVVCYVAGAFLGLLTTSCEGRTDAPAKEPADGAALVRQADTARPQSAERAPVLPDVEVEWGEAANGLRFRIWTDKQRYEEGEDIWLHVEFQNKGAQDCVIRVNYTHQQFPQQKSAPLYDLERVILTREQRDGRSSAIELFPSPSNMFWITPDLLKLASGRTYEEECCLDSGLWRKDGRPPGYVFEPGRHTVQAVYSWPRRGPLTRRQEKKLGELSAELWEGRLVSNKASFEVIERKLPAWGEAVEGLQARLDIKGKQFEAGDCIVAVIRVRNVGDKELRLYDVRRGPSWRLVFTPKDGGSPRRALHRRYLEPTTQVRGSLPLSKGQIRTAMPYGIGRQGWKFMKIGTQVRQPAAAAFETSPDALLPGRYIVTASYGNHHAGYWIGTVTTGAVEIEIAPKEAENE